jgi:hypothetical protein
MDSLTLVATATSVTNGVTVSTNNDKTGYALTSAYDAAKTASQLDAAGVRSAVGLASADLDTQLSAVKSDTGAIKTKTDQLVFTKANELDINVKSVNSVTVNGTGSLGDEWGP